MYERYGLTRGFINSDDWGILKTAERLLLHGVCKVVVQLVSNNYHQVVAGLNLA